ncbi:hypothetical protein IQ266_14200 [filamentous cyanobacterium LEGE 11480]|uniref:Uncharacterized protein n=1 Tax=Romeriopsis navalis LEGE 11480 TaxID=2777977 RepID=A0A928VRL5_9CYAN|nr:hypothetical protein [Romeriopsis navalis]MBE9030884.1 hypothetical protein [Romeriopsis navalis LEGE 11480]
MEPISTAAAIVLSKIVLDKFYEGLSTKLGERVIDTVLAPIKKLGEVVWQRCFKGKPGTEDLLAQAEKGNSEAETALKDYLDKALVDAKLKAEVEPIVQEIRQTIVQIDDDSTMTQINRDNAKGWQTKVQGGTAYIGEIHIHGQN